ncbi:MAG TPA: peptidoglycan recognition family protein [Kofleriaceae bacterium]|nr:peptidoglycan recognition family protein [Kofleriaceae bacterium]
MTRILALAAVVACAAPAAPAGPVTGELSEAADEAGVPVDLVAAVAVEEGGLALEAWRDASPDDNVPVAGRLELRRGRLDTLALGASLVGADELAVRQDTALGTRAGARVLAYLGATRDPATWPAALEQLSGFDDASARAYAIRVLALVRTGGTFAARGGELVAIAPHPALAVPMTRGALVGPDTTPTPDFPGAIWVTTSCTNKCNTDRPLGNAAVNKIVIHDTEGGWDASLATLQNDSGKSVHYLVDADGSRVAQFVPETYTAWHAGNYYYNETSVGIEHVGFAADASGYSDGLYETSAKLVASIRSRFSVPLDRKHVVGHYQIPNGNVMAESSAPCTDTLESCENSASYGGIDNHRDPGFYWQWCQYMERLGGSCTCNDAWPLWNCTSDHAEAWRCQNGMVEEETCTGSAGCTVEPIGQDDVCDTSGMAGSGSGGSDTGSDTGSDPGSDPGSDTGTEPAKHASGCSSGGGNGGLVIVLLVALVSRSRRPSASGS